MKIQDDKMYEYLKQLYDEKLLLSDEICNQLSKYGIDKNEQLNEEITQLKNEFKDKKDIVIENNNIFFFISLDSKTISKYKCKIYLNANKKNYVKTLRKIFNFICSNDIPCECNLSLTVAPDSTIIKTKKIKDCKKIIDYINSDKKIVKNLNPVSPFSVDENMLVICDDVLNYNLFVSGVIYEYFMSIDKSKDEISLKGLVDYLIIKYDYIFNNPKGFNVLKNSCEYQRLLNHFSKLYKPDEEELIFNIDKLFQIFMLQLNPDIKFEYLYDKISLLCDDTYISKKKKEYKKLHSSKFNKFLIKSLLDEYIIYCFDNYGLKETLDKLSEFMNDDYSSEERYLLITKKNNFRKKFVENNMIFNIKRVVSDISSYVNELFNLRSILDSYIILGISKYGITGIKIQLNEFINSTEIEYKYITKSFRDKFEKNQMHINHIRLIKNTSDKYINDLLSIKDILDEYIIWTINNNSVEYLYSQLKAFLDDTIPLEKRYKYITSKNNFRTKFIENNLAIKATRVLNNLDEYISNINIDSTSKETSITVDYSKLKKILDQYIIYSNEIIGYDSTCLLLDVFKNKKNYGLFKEPFAQKFAKYNMAEYIKYLTDDDIYGYVKNVLYANMDIKEEQKHKV